MRHLEQERLTRLLLNSAVQVPKDTPESPTAEYLLDLDDETLARRMQIANKRAVRMSTPNIMFRGRSATVSVSILARSCTFCLLLATSVLKWLLFSFRDLDTATACRLTVNLS